MDPLSTCVLFEQFLVERRYLRNVTASTLEWYQTAFKSLQKTLGADVPPLTKSNLQQFVIAMRGMKPVSCNTYIKAVNAFCLWLHDEGHLDERVQLSLVKVEQRVLRTLSDRSMQTLLHQKPKRFDDWRLHALVCPTVMVLGHTQITTTQRYLHLLTEDLSASHQKVSILNRLA